MTEIKFRCQYHGIQNVLKIIQPKNRYYLGCDCIYDILKNDKIRNMNTFICSECNIQISGNAFVIEDDKCVQYFHIYCSKNVLIPGIVENVDEIKIGY